MPVPPPVTIAIRPAKIPGRKVTRHLGEMQATYAPHHGR
jgi:hypothetical protein